MERAFDPALITIRNNPFLSTRSVASNDGTYMKGLIGDISPYIPSTDPYLEIGILDRLLRKINEIEEEERPQHIFIIGEYGQGKTFSLKKIQDIIYSDFNGGIISYSFGGSSSALLSSIDDFQHKIMEDLESIFKGLDENLYTDKNSVDQEFGLLSTDKNFNQFLLSYDNAFKKLQILIYIFLDELDKIVISSASDDLIKSFLEHLKLISDNCSNSISLIIAGTPNCLAKMNDISIDYSQRFERIEINYLTKEKTIDYISKKCKTKLTHTGYHPFEKSVKSRIYNLTGGNIRKIEAICRELWLLSSRNKRKIDSHSMDIFLYEYLYEPIKNILPLSYSDSIIKFIIKLYLKLGKAGITSMKRGFSNSSKREIENFISTTDYISTLQQSYLLDDNLKGQIDNIF